MNIDDLRARARELARQQDFGEESFDINQRILLLDPRANDARVRLARCHEQAEDWQSAVTCYEQVLAYEPGNPIGRSRLPRARVRTHFPGIRLDEFIPPEPPATFQGLAIHDFAELAVASLDPSLQFRLRFEDLGEALNMLPFAQAVQAIRHKSGKLFHRGMVFGQPGHVFMYHHGGRWEPQCNVGMFAASHWPGNLVRIGIGFNCTLMGRDPDPIPKRELAVRRFRSFQKALAGPLGDQLADWIQGNGGAIQHAGGGPRKDLCGKDSIDWLRNCRSPEDEGWIFVGRWLEVSRDRSIERHDFLEIADSTLQNPLPILASCHST